VFFFGGAARRALSLPQDGAVVGFVGRLIPAKGGDLLLRALARVSDLPFRVALIGAGSERARLEALASELGIAERVHFHGEIPNAAPLFPAFDLFVSSSRSEGSPIVLFEAMAAGVPIAAARVGGVPEALREQDAWLVPPEDPEALARAVREALGDPAAARRRAQSARERLASAYALAPWLDAYEAFYREAIEARARSWSKR
jgi:glycosyltransferase involved in cell wall biosynthesis